MVYHSNFQLLYIALLKHIWLSLVWPLPLSLKCTRLGWTWSSKVCSHSWRMLLYLRFHFCFGKCYSLPQMKLHVTTCYNHKETQVGCMAVFHVFPHLDCYWTLLEGCFQIINSFAWNLLVVADIQEWYNVLLYQTNCCYKHIYWFLHKFTLISRYLHEPIVMLEMEFISIFITLLTIMSLDVTIIFCHLL